MLAIVVLIDRGERYAILPLRWKGQLCCLEQLATDIGYRILVQAFFLKNILKYYYVPLCFYNSLKQLTVVTVVSFTLFSLDPVFP